MSMPARPNLRLSFAADLRIVPKVRRRVEEYLREHGIGERALEEFILALDELCNNAIEHGGADAVPEGSDEKVGCLLLLRADAQRSEVVASLRSRGHLAANELAAMMEATGLPDLESERGRGLFLFRAMVDAFEVANVDDDKLEVRFKKRW
ncbi:MAG: ATP-binding protein [Planctomycetes bacterium]|nr:ATP-binding protein [Planctomycetota bacterium]